MKIAVIGGGPAGLRAAEVAASGGAAVTLFDAKPSVGRKFLVAGRGGLNLTKDEPQELFASHYQGDDQQQNRRWDGLIADFGPAALREWAEGLGVQTFVASTRRVYPRDLKAAPLLRRWVRRLRNLGVDFTMHYRWDGLCLSDRGDVQVDFQVGGGGHSKVQADAVILALGGGSWPQTGSNGEWTKIMESLGVAVAPLEPANCGWECAWSKQLLAIAEGKPLKNISVSAGGKVSKGELLVTKYGLEGGALYELGPALRGVENPVISIDFKPSTTLRKLVTRMESARGNYLEEARQRWRLGDAAVAILANSDTAPYGSAEALAREVKDCHLRLTQARPLAEAISSAGGVRWRELDAGLMLEKLPGVFLAGEMIDWEAPTGGYLLHGCFATATQAAKSALDWRRRLAKGTLSASP
ncbi:MAG TPA: TIGR03862 family flavoprotein [Chthoniobacteraceae bacterium]|nr:TIGR03862 family flavoprotein [Chthoniobacteraceae bacterium]